MIVDMDFAEDIADVGQIPIISSLLDVICKNTGMGFAALARVTETRWITCSVNDTIGFGLKPGDELEVETTICHEIRESRQAVVIDNVNEDALYHSHHTALKYGLQSYISVPVYRKSGAFFGTLCAIDPKPHDLSSTAILEMFNLFAELISFHLEAIETIRAGKKQLIQEKAITETLEKEVRERTTKLTENNASLQKMNEELKSFAYITSHDLQEPLRKIQFFSSMIMERELKNLSDNGKDFFKRMQNAAHRMQSLIDDLLSYSRTSTADRKFELTDLSHVLLQVKKDLQEEGLQESDVTIVAHSMCHCHVIPFQIHQLFYNLITNAIKFSVPERPLAIAIGSTIIEGADVPNIGLVPDKKYCHIRVSDNGIGFEQQYSTKIFELFQRLHERTAYEGTGIGLAIVKKIVGNHNGIIIATGIPNEGATFDLYLSAE